VALSTPRTSGPASRPFRSATAKGALALGFGSIGTFLNVTFPIGGRIALPSSINTCVSILKNSAVLGPAIGFAELTNEAYRLESESFKALEIYTVLAVTYLAIVWALSAAIRGLEAHLRLPEERRRIRRQPLGEAA
jgi:polar amino acid transport system permease protein